MKIRLLGAAAFAALLNSSAWAQAPAECYRLYPGAKGRSCCNSSFDRVSFGNMPNSARMAS
jgi:hypothetical protein